MRINIKIVLTVRSFDGKIIIVIDNQYQMEKIYDINGGKTYAVSNGSSRRATKDS
jgi:hypothetical protein